MSLIFNGHIDTDPVFVGCDDPYNPRIEDRRLIGHGLWNMKAAVAAMVYAARAIKKAGVELKGDLIVEPVVGEIQGGIGTYYNTFKKNIMADYGLVPEPTMENLRTLHAGAMEVAITVKGTSQHISRMGWGSVDALDKTIKVIEALKRMKFPYKPDPRIPGLPRFVIGALKCGHGDDQDLRGAAFIIDNCTMIVDIRYLPGMQPWEDIRKVLEVLKAEDPELKYELKLNPEDPFEDEGMPWQNFRCHLPPQDISPDEHIVKVVAKNHKEVTGKDPEIVGPYPLDHQNHSHQYAGADDAHLTKAGIISLCYGPKARVDPQGNQYVDIDSMMTVAKVYALTALDICTRAK